MALAARAITPGTEQPYRTAPQNVEAEQALLGAILVNNEAFYRVSDFLEPNHFQEPVHRRIYQVAGELIRANKVANPVTLKTFLPAELAIGDINLAQYLARLAAAATTIINAEDYGRTIYDLAVRRSLIGIGEDMVNLAYDAPVESTPRDQIEEAERRLYEVAEKGRYDGGFHAFETALLNAIDMASAAYKRDGHLSGIATGLEDLDRQMGGLQPSDLIILAGRPGMGKTALATNIAFAVARAWQGAVQPDGTTKTVDGGIVGFFSLEMSSEQLATRIVSEQSSVPSSDIRRGRINEDQFANIVAAAREMQRVPLYIDQTGGLTIGQLAARARRLKRQRGLDLLVIDYIQLMQASSRRGSDNRVQEVTEITNNLKALAKELNVPILALSQLSRQVENREDKRPQLSDLRESGSIEQDADVVLFVFREEYYLKNKEPRPGSMEHEQWRTEMEQVHGLAEVIIGKQRHGPTGTVPLQFEDSLTRFSSLAREATLPAPSAEAEAVIFKALFGRKDAGAVKVGGTKELLSLTQRVDVPVERAFAVFVDELNSWWPREYSWAGENLETIGIEPRYGGRCFERAKDGTTTAWGTVLAVERPNHIVFAWQITADRQPEQSEATSSRVDVRFAAAEPGKTDVLLVHRDFFRHGDGWEKYKEDMAGKKGWPYLMAAYARRVGNGD